MSTGEAVSNSPTDQAERMRRVHAVYKMMCRGESRTTIVRSCAESWGIKTRVVDNYMSEARDLLREDFAVDRFQFAIETMANLRELRSLSIRSGQYSVALGCTTRMATLAQLDGFKHGNAK